MKKIHEVATLVILTPVVGLLALRFLYHLYLLYVSVSDRFLVVHLWRLFLSGLFPPYYFYLAITKDPLGLVVGPLLLPLGVVWLALVHSLREPDAGDETPNESTDSSPGDDLRKEEISRKLDPA